MIRRSPNFLLALVRNGFVYLCFLVLLIGCGRRSSALKAVPIIFDSDMGPDYDDVGAIAALHAFADRGEARILATVASTKYEGVASVLNIFNTWFGKDDIPVGVPQKYEALTLRDWQHWSDSLIVRYPHQLRKNSDAYDAVELYRKVLAAQPDRSVTIVTVGFLTNLAYLLRSGPDDNSPLNGVELVRSKVKQLVSMAGRFPEGSEFNVEKDAASSRFVFEHWPTEILFSGFEIGVKVRTGLGLLQTYSGKSPVKDAYRISMPLAEEDAEGRMSWDQTAVLVAVKGHSPYYTLRRGKIVLSRDGSNGWVDDENGRHAYLVQKMPPERTAALIEELMMHRPGQIVRKE